MGDKSGIQWTEATWNPIVGCAAVSPGCDHCYAAKETAGRLRGLPVYAGLATREPGEPAQFTGEVRLLLERLDQPLRWRRPRLIFVNSMSDLFHPGIPEQFIADVFAVMGRCPRHTFQVLTKRPQRMAALLGDGERWLDLLDVAMEAQGQDHFAWHVPYGQYPPRWEWLGTSIELDRYTFRADFLRQTPSAVRFLSLEPLLGPLPSLGLTDIDWVIVGGESGTGARPMDLGWVRDLRDRCADVGAAFFVKQLGSCSTTRGHRDLKGADIESFPADLRIRQMPGRSGA